MAPQETGATRIVGAGMRASHIHRRKHSWRSVRANAERRSVRQARAAQVGRIVLVLCAAVLLVLPVLLIASPVSYVPLIAAVLLVIVSGVYLQVLRRSLTVDIAQMSTSCERGSNAGLAVSLANASILPYPRVELEFFVTDLFGEYDDIHRLTCALSPREETKLPFDVRFTHLGSYEVGIEHVVIYDLLGLFHARFDEGRRRSVVVRPRKVNMQQMATMKAAPDEAKNMLKPIATDDMDYSSVREYHYGDPLKTIHWNLTSKSPNQMMYTRLYETYVNPSLAIILDPYSPDWDSDDLMSLFDGMVESAAGLAAAFREAGMDAEVRYVDKDHIPSPTRLSSISDADDLVQDMLRITPEVEATSYATEPEMMLRNAGLASHGFGNVALVTTRPDPGFINTLIEVRMRKRNAFAFVAVPRSLEDPQREKFLAPLKRLAAAGVPYYIVESTEAMTKVVGLS